MKCKGTQSHQKYIYKNTHTRTYMYIRISLGAQEDSKKVKLKLQESEDICKYRLMIHI